MTDLSSCNTGSSCSIPQKHQKRWGRVYSMTINYKSKVTTLEEFTCDDVNYTLVSKKLITSDQEYLDIMKDIYGFDISADEKMRTILEEFKGNFMDLILFWSAMDLLIVKMAAKDRNFYQKKVLDEIYSSLVEETASKLNNLVSEEDRLITKNHKILACQINLGTKKEDIRHLRKSIAIAQQDLKKKQDEIAVLWNSIFPNKPYSIEHEEEFTQQIYLTGKNNNGNSPDCLLLFDKIEEKNKLASALVTLTQEIGKCFLRFVYIDPKLLDQVNEVSDVVNPYKFYSKKIADPIEAELRLTSKQLSLVYEPNDVIETYKILSWYQSIFSSRIEDIMPLLKSIVGN